MSDTPLAAGSGRSSAAAQPQERNEEEGSSRIIRSPPPPPSIPATADADHAPDQPHATIFDVLAVTASEGHAKDLDRCGGLDNSTWRDTELWAALSKVEYKGKWSIRARTRMGYNIKEYRPERVKWLLGRGACPNPYLKSAADALERHGCSAEEKETAREIGLLFARHLRTDPGQALVMAMELGDIALMHKLAGKGADVLSKRPGWTWRCSLTPLQHASHRHNLEAIRALLAHGAVVGEGNEDSALRVAVGDMLNIKLRNVERYSAAVMELALHPSCPPLDALFAAEVCGRHDLFPSLIEKGARTSPPSFMVRLSWHVNDYPLMALACISGSLPLVAYLIEEEGVDVNQRMRKMDQFGFHGSTDTTPDADGPAAAAGITPLMVAARCNHSHLIPYLVQMGADLEAKTAWGETAICFPDPCDSEDFANLNTFQTLIDAGTQVDLQDVRVRTLFHRPCRAGSPELVRAFLERGGAGPGGVSGNSEILLPFLCEAAKNKRFEIARVLLNAGAAVHKNGGPANLVDALIAAATGVKVEDHLAVLKLLLAAGANPTAKRSQDRLTALQCVQKRTGAMQPLAETLLEEAEKSWRKKKKGSQPGSPKKESPTKETQKETPKKEAKKETQKETQKEESPKQEAKKESRRERRLRKAGQAEGSSSAPKAAGQGGE